MSTDPTPAEALRRFTLEPYATDALILATDGEWVLYSDVAALDRAVPGEPDDEPGGGLDEFGNPASVTAEGHDAYRCCADHYPTRAVPGEPDLLQQTAWPGFERHQHADGSWCQRKLPEARAVPGEGEWAPWAQLEQAHREYEELLVQRAERAEAALRAERPGVDVDVLAEAYHRWMGHKDTHPDFRGCTWCTPWAKGIAREYDRLMAERGKGSNAP